MAEDHRQLVNFVLFATFQLILFFVAIPALIPRPAQVIAIAVIGWYFYRVIFTQTTGDFINDYGLGSSMPFQWILSLSYGVLIPPDTLKDLHDKDQTSMTKRPLKEQVLWALKLFSNPRGIGWTHEASHLPPRPSPSTPRSRFVISRICLAAFYFLIFGGTQLFDAHSGIITDKLITGAPLHLRVLGVLSFGLSSLCMLCGGNAALSAGAVGSGLSSPERWPPLFGSPLEAWSIRRFWRNFWHQMIRTSVLTFASSILQCILPAKHVGTTGYKLAQMYMVFFFSGIAHGSGDVMSTGKLCFGSFTFFMLQPVGITIEIAVSHLWRRLQHDECKKPTATGNTKNNIERAREKCPNNGNISSVNGKRFAEESIPPLWIRCVGTIWVALWMVWTAAYMADPVYSGRLSANRGRI